MAFTMVRGGRPVETGEDDDNRPSWERTLDERPGDDEEPPEGGQDEHENDDEGQTRSPAEYEDAVALNQKLKAMLAEADASQKRLNAASGVRAGKPPPRGGKLPGVAPPSAAGYPPVALGGESSQGINRRKLEQKVQKENAGFAVRLAGSKSCILPPVGGGQRPGQPESSQTINRRRMEVQVQHENARLVARIEQPTRSKSWAAPRKVGESELPKGWSRGIGGRAMPPPKLRWGPSKYDAGEMNF